MTLGECKRKVYKLLDEYSSGGEVSTDDDLELRMTDLIDMGQKDVAGAKKLYRRAVIAPQEETGRYLLPEDMIAPVALWQEGKRVEAEIFAGELLFDGTGEVTVEYVAMPATIPQEAGEEYELEVAQDAAECIPYFVAGNQLLADIVTDYSPFWQIYLQKKAQLAPSVLRRGGGGVRQVLYRRS